MGSLKFLHSLCLLCLFLAPLAFGQVVVTDKCPADAPVSLRPTTVFTEGQREAVTITNKGPKPITAVILHWSIMDSADIPYNETSTVDYAPSGTLFEPGKSTQTDIGISVNPGNTVKSITVTCSAVLYQGYGVWGDAKGPEVARIKATRQGVMSERRRLQEILKNGGAAALETELNRPLAN